LSLGSGDTAFPCHLRSSGYRSQSTSQTLATWYRPCRPDQSQPRRGRRVRVESGFRGYRVVVRVTIRVVIIHHELYMYNDNPDCNPHNHPVSPEPRLNPHPPSSSSLSLTIPLVCTFRGYRVVVRVTIRVVIIHHELYTYCKVMRFNHIVMGVWVVPGKRRAGRVMAGASWPWL
jgi:hypothetical protein